MASTAEPTPTRQRLLDAGMQLWVDEPPAVLFGGYSVARLAKAAKVTRATFYSYWPSTEDYLHDLIDHLGHHSFEGYETLLSNTAGAVASAGNDVLSQLLAACDLEFTIMLADPALRVRLGFLSEMDDPVVAEKLTARYRAFEALKNDGYTKVIEGWGREPRPPFDWASLQAVYAMLGDAMAARHRMDPEGLPMELYGQVVVGLLMIVTRRIDDTRTLPALIGQVNAWPAEGLRLQAQIKAERAAHAPPSIDESTAREIVFTGRRLLATMGWQEVGLNEIASIMGLTEEALLRAFGSKSGLAMSIFLLNVFDRLAELPRTGDPITDLRAMLALGAHELRRLPALTQSVVLLFAGTAAMPMPGITSQWDPIPAFVAQATAAQAAGQLRPDLDAATFTGTLLRVVLTENAPPAATPWSGIDAAELMLLGAGAPPPTDPAPVA